MKNMLYIVLLILFTGCIEEYTPKGIEEITDLLVVEGTITNGESVFRLSRSVGLSEQLTGEEGINNATVFVEIENGERLPGVFNGSGTYIVSTGELDKEKKYCLYIAVDGEEYRSDFLSPLFTPEIDRLNLTKRNTGDPVYLCVSTHDPTDQSRYYLWSYKEIWEVKADLYANYGFLNGELMFFSLMTAENTYYCWGRDSSKVLLLGSSEKLTENIIYENRLKEMVASDDRLSILYYVVVKQTQIRKETYDYCCNIQKNIEQTGSIFAPVPSEMNGNIRSVTNPDLPVIGYIDVSTTTLKKEFFPSTTDIYEAPRSTCFSDVTDDPEYEYPVYGYYENYPWDDPPKLTFAPHLCVDCRLKPRATKNRPDFWPNAHF